MRTQILFATLLTLAMLTVGHAQTVDKAKLYQFLDLLAEKNKGMGSLTLAQDEGTSRVLPRPGWLTSVQ